MSEDVRLGLVCMIVLLTGFQEGVTGFGSTVLALPFVTLLLGLKTAVPVLVILAWVLAALIVLESRRHIVWREYFHIALLVAVGLPFGIWLRQSRPPEELRWILAGFMVAVGAQGLIRQLMGRQHSKMSPRKKLSTSAFLPLGGIIHGAFGTGGPLVVIYAARAITEKTLFRVTMCMMWFTINTIVITQWATGPVRHMHIARTAAVCLPFTLLGLFVGNKAHYRINENVFRMVVYSVLIASGAFLVWSLVG
jgi:uncharacterized membrane protein YfcA